MLFSSLFQSAALAASLVASVSAAPAQHVHNNHKRALVIVTETVVVTADAPQVIAGESTTVTFETLNTAAPATDSAESTVTREQQHVGSEAPVSTYISSVVPSATASASSSAHASALPSSDSSFSLKGVTYSPYTASGECKSLSEVKSDVAALSDYEIIRLYGVDCTQVENVFQAKADGQKLFLGIYFVDQIEAGISEMASAVKQYGSWDDVHTVSIGNELVNGGLASVSQIGQYVSTARSALTSAGYSGPVVSVDTHTATINNPGLCEFSDYIAINAHAYFDYNTAAADSGEWLLEQIQRVWTVCGGKKDVFVTESGWPHQGDTYGKAIASPEAQSAAISSLKSVVGKSVILFNAYDDYWKADGFLNCEKYWGIN
jgi:exo-beta-1,3-glucanase (GH17 family)